MQKTFLYLVAIVLFLGTNSIAAEISALSTKEVQGKLHDPSWVVVDARLNDAYNGWKLDGITRGGHIAGAVDFSANWLAVEAKNLEAQLQDALKRKGIVKEKNIIIYDANEKDAQKVVAYLTTAGYTNLYTYNIRDWAKDPSLPMEHYSNYQKIVPAVIVKEILDGKTPESFDKNSTIKIVEASWGAEKASYAKGHIPSAFHINTDLIEPPTTTEPIMWLLADDAQLAQFAIDYGFQKNDTVIVTANEPMASYRVATVLQYIGVKDVRVLNGGTLSWTMAGYQLETKSHKPVAVTDFGGPIPGNPDVIDTMAETKAGLAAPQSFCLVDNRTWDERIGKSSGYSYHDKKGRIPGSVFGYAGTSGSYGMEYYRNPDKTMRRATEFLQLWEKQGIDTTKHLSFMCGSGWRVAEIYYYADVYGLKDIGIFSDGWIGWSNTAGNPTETGEPQK